jgi:hypothetical protein
MEEKNERSSPVVGTRFLSETDGKIYGNVSWKIPWKILRKIL